MTGRHGPSRARHIVLVGMPGSGKTTTGRALAARLGRPFVDTDHLVEKATGQKVADVFAALGEEAFRAQERRAISTAIAAPVPAVIAVGGGAVLDPENRPLLAAAGQVCWLRAETATLRRHVGDARSRPLLAGDPERALARLGAERAPIYAAVPGIVAVDIDGLRPPEVAARVAEALLRTVTVDVPGRPYDVVVGPGARAALGRLLPPAARRCVVVSQAGIALPLETGLATTRIEIGSGERHKSLATIEQCCRAFVAAGLTRADVVIALGGGMVTDVAGFAAASYHRGVAVVHVATSLLAQVDAAIGGKTGVNLPEGKNLVGAFWQPRGVLCDTDALTGLPEREWRSGLGEMAKYAFLGVEDLDELPLVEQVARCVAQKAAVVASDERESGGRVLLNYGHTLAHALEASGLAGESGDPGALDLRHGEAVAIGLVFAARLAARLGRIGPERVQRHLEVVRAYGLPEAVPAGADPEALLTAMGRDKKATDGLNFVLDGPAGVELVRSVDRADVAAVLEECREERA